MSRDAVGSLVLPPPPKAYDVTDQRETRRAIELAVSRLGAVKPVTLPYVVVTDAPYNARNDATVDATASINKAITDVAALGGGVVMIPTGTYLVNTGNVTIALGGIGVTLQGAGKYATVLRCNNEFAHMVTMTGTLCNVYDMQFEHASGVARTAGSAIKIQSPAAQFILARLRFGSTFRYVECIGSDDANSQVTTGWIRDCQFYEQPAGVGTHNRGFFFQCASGVRVENIVGSITRNQLYADFTVSSGCDTITLRHCETGTGGFGGQATGFHVESPLSSGAYSFYPHIIRCLNCYFEAGTTSNAYEILAADYDVSLIDCYAASSSTGFYIDSGHGVSLVRCIAYANQLHGIQLHGGNHVTLIGCIASDNSQNTTNTYSGIAVDSSLVPHFSISDCTSGNMLFGFAKVQKYGIVIFAGAGSVTYRLTNNHAVGNGTAQILDSGAPSTYKELWGNDGLGNSSTTSIQVTGGAFVAGGMYADPGLGYSLCGKTGGTYDLTLLTAANTVGMAMKTGTADWVVGGALAVGTGFGCNGKGAQTAYALGAAATDLATVITLANNLRTMAINNGIGVL